MAEGSEVTITAKIVADTKGGKDAEHQLDRLKEKSKDSTKSASAGFQQAVNSASRYGNFIRRLTDFSIFTGGLASVLSLWDRITASTRKAKEEAVELAKEEAKAEDKKRIDDLAESYRKLGKAIADAAKERQRANELEDLKTSEADKLEDSEANLAKAREIAALDPNDPAYAEKKQRIENAYDVAAAKRGVDRQRRDAETKEKREYDEAEALHGEATDKEFSLIDDRNELERLRRKANVARSKSVQENEFDVKTFTDSFVNNLRSILSLDGEHFWSDRTARGDEERKSQAAEADRYDQQAKELEARIREKEAEIADIRSEATQHSNKAGVYGMSAANTSIAQDTAEIQGKVSAAEADRALARREAEERRKAAEKARQEKELADARALLSGGDARAESLRSRIDANNRQITATSFQVASGSMGSDAGARVVAELQSQNTSLNELLTALLRQIEQSKRVIERANERARNSSGVDDSSEGA